ncbi:MAG: translocation/assembly module TamB domain-containing protein, partial [Candidatus Binatia bacterium]
YRRERLRLDLLLRQDADHVLLLQGGLPLYLGWADGKPPAVLGEADLRLKSDGLSPAFLGVFTDEVENIKGTIIMDLRLRGPVWALVPQGELQLRQGQGQAKSLGLFVRGVELQARVTREKLHVTRLLARSGTGEISGSGHLAFKGRAPQTFALALRAEDFRVLNRRDLQAAVTGGLTLSGSPERPFVRGDLTVTESSLRPDLQLLRRGPPPPDPTIIVVLSEEGIAARDEPAQEAEAAARPAQNRFLYKLGLDLSVKIPRNTWVRLEEGSVEFAGAVHARKKPEEPLALAGAVEMLRGSYNFQGKQFRIERGKVVFTGGSEIDPQLDVMARHRVGKYLVDLVIGGTATKPTLTLRSNPPLEEADVLSVLLFGKPVGALTESQQVGLRSQAVKAAADFVASDLRQSVARRLGLDNLEFEFGEDVSQGRIAVGKYVTQDAFVSASQGVGKEKEQEYSLEYQLAPNWQLKSSTTTQGESGIDLIWRKEY